MKASEVFTPGSTPRYTYYDRPDQKLEEYLLNAVETKGYLTSVSGPSKCGKTVLCESVLGSSMILIPGGGINNERIFWDRLRTKLDLPTRRDAQKSIQEGSSKDISGHLSVGTKDVLGGGVGLTGGKNTITTSSLFDSYAGPNGPQMLEYMNTQKIRLVVDDFHYISTAVQKTLAEQFKEAARHGTTIVLVSVSQRSDQAIRANPDLRGRLLTIDIPYWNNTELRAIPKKGFKVLNVDAHDDVISLFAQESVGSPQLMQALCLELCRYWKLEEPYETPRTMLCPSGAAQNFLRQTVALANCKTAFDILEAGPRIHGSARKVYHLKNGSQGDVYAVILRALGAGTPRLSLHYKEILEKIQHIVVGEPPSGASVVSALGHSDQIVKEKLPNDRVIEWDIEKDVLNVLDPYFLYYLRWSGLATGLD